jgi:hypothetical protein
MKLSYLGVIWTLAGFSKILNNNSAFKFKKADIYSKGPILSQKMWYILERLFQLKMNSTKVINAQI